MSIIEDMDNMQQEDTDVENLFDEIEKVLSRHGHSKDDIVCVLWGDGTESPDISIDVGSFWKYAKNTEWDREVWVSGPHFPLALLSGRGWWIEVSEYDSRTFLAYREEPKAELPLLSITEDGKLTTGKNN